ncbi:SDR family NAD(P)-dependent oxidoreductase [Cerasicoccus frondis]|uniref:SDR family NAD(P)-dependent oxidoreductase n=1 Tax=Cerasicoccus frondis TaxID=490090 RepID=UPI0028529369|nr:SDR family oxidoreductase [Cerasicoccus frondis]
MSYEQPEFWFKGKAAIVTGGAQGLGFAAAQKLAEHGARVFIADRDEALAQQSAVSLPGEGHGALFCDVTSDADRQRVVNHVVREAGGLHILLNNAGIQYHADAAEMDDEGWRRVFEVNVHSMMFMSKLAARQMIAQREGSIVNIGSISSFFGMPRRSVYVTTKTAVLGMSRGLASEWAPYNVRVNVVCPGYHETKLFKDYVDKGVLDPEVIRGRIPMGRLGTPGDIGNAVVMLCSPLASYITGQSIMVDGGYTIYGAPNAYEHAGIE